MSEDLCPSCGEGSLQTRLEVRRYGRGIDVTLVDVPVRRCPVCGEELVVVPAIEELHRLIAHDLARRSGRLRSGEIRFLRTYLGYSSADFAQVIGVSPETVSRWESARSPQQMAVPAERLLRLMALQDNPVQSYSLAAADDDGATKSVTLRLATTPAGWTAVA